MKTHTLSIALEIAQEICAGTIDPYRGAVRIWIAVREAQDESFDDLIGFIVLASDWQDDPSHRELIAGDICDEARRLVQQFDSPDRGGDNSSKTIVQDVDGIGNDKNAPDIMAAMLIEIRDETPMEESQILRDHPYLAPFWDAVSARSTNERTEGKNIG